MANTNLKKNDLIPDGDHVVRHVPWKSLRKDAEDNVLGVLPQGFQLREGEDGLSLSRLEHFGENREEQLKEVTNAIRESKTSKSIGKKSALAIGNTLDIKEVCRKNGKSIRIVYRPSTPNPSHCEIKGLPREDVALLHALADEAFKETILCGPYLSD